MNPETKPAPSINITPKPPATPNNALTRQDKPKGQGPTLESWVDKTIGTIFRITLDPNHTRDAHGHRLFFVAGVRGDLEDAGSPIRLTTDVLDSAIVESAQSRSEGKALDYLLGCWKRVSRLFRGFSNKNDPKFEVLKEARRVCFSYSIFAATIPDMFGEEESPTNPLVNHLLVDPENDQGICHEYLGEAISRFEEDESVKELLIGAMEELSRTLSTMTMNDNYRPYMLAMRNFVRYRPLLEAMAQSPRAEGLGRRQARTGTVTVFWVFAVKCRVVHRYQAVASLP